MYYVGAGKIPSTAFCLLLRLLTMRCSDKQMKLMLKHPDSPYIRAIGFLYLRYACQPESIWGYIHEFIYDEEPIQVTAKNNSSGRNNNGTIGGFVRSLFSSSTRDFYGTMLPRLPIHLERELAVKLLQAEKVQSRAESHFRDQRTMEYFQKLGSKVMATYEDEENPLQWYNAVVDRVILRDEDGIMYKHPRFVVTFEEYGNTETVTLGEMDLPDGKFYREDSRAEKGRDNRRDQELYEEIRRRERDTVTAKGRDQYARPPPTTKRSLAGATSSSSSSRSAPHGRHRRSPSPVKRSPPRHHGERATDKRGNHSAQQQQNQQPSHPPPRKRTAEEIAAMQEKKRKLAARYG